MENAAAWVIVIVVVAGFVAAIALARKARRKERRREELVERLVDRLGARRDHEGGWSVVRFQTRGYTASLVCDHGVNDEPACTRVSVHILGISRGALKIFPDQVPKFFKKLLRMQDIVIGDADFDREFVVQATPVTLAGRIFAKERRQRAVAAVRQVAALGPSRIDLTVDRLELKVFAEFTEFERFLTLLDATEKWLDLLQEVAPVAEIHWMQVEAGGPGLCLVCGTALEGRTVNCAKCRTTHHEECWKYAGRCSTFGCGERRFA